MIRLIPCVICLAVVLAIGPACRGQYEEPLPPVEPPRLEPMADPLPDGALVPAQRYFSAADRRLPPECTPASCNDAGTGSGCYRTPLSRAWHNRVKPFLQKSHWGYCNHFDERPFGEAVQVTMSRQIHRGSANMLMLYHYDFYPAESPHAAELTSRGEAQLLKMVYRMHATPAPILIQVADDDPQLDELRRLNVVGALSALGVDAADQLVMLGRQRFGTPGVEALENAENLLNAVRARGRTLQSAETPRFGSTISSGGTFGR